MTYWTVGYYGENNNRGYSEAMTIAIDEDDLTIEIDEDDITSELEE